MATARRVPDDASNEEFPPLHELTEGEFVELFDSIARDVAGMSGNEFVARWHAGQIHDWDPELADLVMMLPFLPASG